MHCNHRSPRKPGACQSCWRFGIVMWSLMLVGTIVAVAVGGHRTDNFGMGLLFLGIPAFIIVHSICTKWNGGDR